jgi:hypothetical protein
MPEAVVVFKLPMALGSFYNWDLSYKSGAIFVTNPAHTRSSAKTGVLSPGKPLFLICTWHTS